MQTTFGIGFYVLVLDMKKVQSILRRASLLLTHGDVKAAARCFSEAMGLSYETLERGKNNPSNVGGRLGELIGALDSPRQGEVGWWREVAEGWRLAGVPELAMASVGRGRQMAERGCAASWADLESLAELALTMPAPLLIAPGDPESRKWLMARREFLGQKKGRIAGVFGIAIGDANVVRHRAESSFRAGDVAGIVLCVSTDQDPLFHSLHLVQAWYQADEHRLAVEAFLAAIAGQPLIDWLSEAPQAVVDCGRSLYYLGDQVTAYACFRLALQVSTASGQAADGDKDSAARVGSFQSRGRFLPASVGSGMPARFFQWCLSGI